MAGSKQDSDKRRRKEGESQNIEEEDDPDGTDKNPDKTCVKEPVNTAKTKQELGGVRV